MAGVEPFYIPPANCQIPEIDRLYRDLWGAKTDGVFVEIGAYDGESHSNTSFLADLGWRGYYVEPVPDFAARCAARHKDNNVQVLNMAVGPEAGTAKLSVADAISSMWDHHIEAFEKVDWGQGKHSQNIIEVPVITPDDLRSRIPEQRIDLIVIDCEGAEWPIVQAMDMQAWRPDLWIVETRDQNAAFSEEIRRESQQVIDKILAAGYDVYWRDTLNIMLRRSGG